MRALLVPSIVVATALGARAVTGQGPSAAREIPEAPEDATDGGVDGDAEKGTPTPGDAAIDADAAQRDEELAYPSYPARRGLQLGIRTGASFPMGQVVRDTDLADVYAWQLPLFFDIGAKTGEHVFVGGYLGASFGAPANDRTSLYQGLREIPIDCDRADTTCPVVALRIGVQVQYHVAPSSRFNPWVGAGVGAQTIWRSIDSPSVSLTIRDWGVEVVRPMIGVDFRISPIIGFGPYADLAVVKDFEERPIRFWLTAGLRFVVLP